LQNDEWSQSEDLGREIGLRSSFKTPVVVGVIQALADLIPEFLSNGNILDLGNVGSFRIAFSSEGVDKPEDLKKPHTQKVKVQYKQPMVFKQEIKKITFKKIS
jgi:predicted histone-like DNA-binding protein